MANASFMSMRWLRLHIKEIIWATVILFVGSIFVIGYGTSRQIQNQEERKKMAEEAERKASERKNTAPAHLQSKLSLPVAHISFPTQTASLTSVIDVKTLWNSIKDSPEYQQVSNMPTGIKEFYGGMIKERALESLITISLVDLYAQANNIKPQITAQAIVERDRQQITPVEFDRELRRKGITTDEWGSERLKQLTMQAVAQSIVKPIPPASATEEVLKNYYETNKIRFMEDDQISFNHLLVSPSNFAGKAELNDEQIKSHFDAHRSDFMSSERVQLTHIMIKNEDEGYLNSIEVNDKEVRRRYTDNIEKYKNPEKVKASHILIKPKNSFDHDFASYKIAMRNFVIAESDAGTLVTFDASLANLGPDSNLDFDSFAVKTSDGKLFYPSISSQEKAENALELPLSGSTRNSVSGQIAIDLEKGTQPAELLIKDGTVTATFDISSAFDNEKAFAAARAEIEKIAELIKGGKDFAELARSRSQDTGSAAKGGDLGAFARGSMVKPFEDMAFTSNVGQISEPVRTQFGYHLIKVEEKIPEKVRSIDEVRAELIKEYQLEQADMKASASLESIRQKIIHKSESIEKLAKENSMGGARKSNGLLPVFFKGEITDDYSAEQKKILIDDLSDDGVRIAPEIEEAVFSLEPNEVSDVIKTSKGYHVFVMNKKLEPIQLNLTSSLKVRIHKILEEKAQEEMARVQAEKLKKDYPDAGIEFLAKTFQPEAKELKISFGPLPFSVNPGFSNVSLSDGMGKFTEDGRTFLPEVHKTMMSLIKDGSFKGKIAGPFKSSLGYHFLEVTAYEGNRYQPYEEVKEKIRKWLTLEPSQEDIEKEFAAQKDQLDRPALRKIRQIIVTEERIANELHDRLKKGEIFALLAQKYSVDSGSSQQGGLVPPVKKGQLSGDLDKQVWNLKKGEFTSPVKTSYGYVIAYLDADEIPGSQATMTPDVISQLKKNLKQGIQEEVWMAFIKSLSHQAHVIRHPQAISEI